MRRKKSNPSCSLLNSRPTERGRLDLFSGTVGSSPNSLLTCVNCFWNLAAISFREPNFSVLIGPFPCVPERTLRIDFLRFYSNCCIDPSAREL